MISIEPLSEETLSDVTKLVIALWTECIFDKEYLNCQRILKSDSEKIFLSKSGEEYTGFIQLSLRSEHVEGTSSSPVAYIEGIYVKPAFQRTGVGKKLVEKGANWGRSKGVTEYASDVELSNKNSLKFHRKMGFNEVNRIACFSKKLY